MQKIGVMNEEVIGTDIKCQLTKPDPTDYILNMLRNSEEIETIDEVLNSSAKILKRETSHNEEVRNKILDVLENFYCSPSPTLNYNSRNKAIEIVRLHSPLYRN